MHPKGIHAAMMSTKILVRPTGTEIADHLWI